MLACAVVLVSLSSLLYTGVAGQSPSQLPSFTLHPQSSVIASGETTNLTCSATGPSPITYGWLRDNSLIGGANVPWYLVLASDAGEYSCLATNTVGTVTSSVANVQQAILTQSFFSTSPLSPYPISVALGQTAVISCGGYTSVPDVRISWEIYDEDGNLPLIGTDKAIAGLNGELFLQDAGSLNNVVYECVVTNRDIGEVVNGFVQVTVQDTQEAPSNPAILSAPQDMVVNQGDSAFFECIVGGQPLAAVDWSFPPGSNPTTKRLMQNSAILRVRSVESGDAGVYTCSASGVGTFTATLSIAGSPVVTSPLPSALHTVVYWSPLTLTCGASQSGTWQWFFQGVRVADATGPVLEVSNTGLEDAGVYQCFITNSAGFDSSTALVEVQTIPASITTPLPSPQLAFMERSLQLTCVADGAPPPSYIWTKESVPLANNLAFEVSDSGLLTIVTVDISSGGNYTCVATNAVGGQVVGSASTSTIVTAIEPTVLTSEPGDVFKIQVGTTAMLVCEASSDTAAQVTFSWTKDGQPLQLGARITRVSPSLSGTVRFEAAQRSDAGVYVCTVTTLYDGIMGPPVQSTPINLTIIDAPVAPIILSVTPTSSSSLNVQWNFPGSSTILHSYRIELQTVNNGLGWSVIRTQMANLVTVADIEDLTPHTQYSVRIVAVYTEGESTVSDEIGARTLADIPAGPPTEIRAEALNTTTLRFTWQPPVQSNGPLTDYTLQYRLLREQNDVEFSTLTVGSGSAQTFVLGRLQPLERYEYRLAAETSIGVGPFSAVQLADTVANTLEEPPTGPFYTQIWFIVVMVAVVVLLIMSVGGTFLLVAYATKYKSQGTYSFHGQRSSVVSDRNKDSNELADDVFRVSYSTRSKRSADLELIASRSGIDGETDLESTVVDSYSNPYTPQLSTSSRMNLVPPGLAPGYINPPSFEEAISRPRSHSSHSHHSSMAEKSPTEYWEEEGSKSVLIDEPLTDFEGDSNINSRVVVNGGYQDDHRQQPARHQLHHTGRGHLQVVDFGYDLDENDSIGKPSFASSEVTDATEYSHLQAMGDAAYSHLETPQANSTANATFV